MAVKIRLRRAGANRKPFYRVVVADARHPIKGRFIENVGWYDPKQGGVNFELKLDRVEYWTAHGAQMSDTVQSLVKKRRNGAVRTAEKPAEPTPPEVKEETPKEVAPEVPAEETPAPVAEESAPALEADEKQTPADA